MRTPAGPSARTTAGTPRRGISLMTPAAPGAFTFLYALGLNISARPPTMSSHFSSRVMASMISWMLFSESLSSSLAEIVPDVKSREMINDRIIVLLSMDISGKSIQKNVFFKMMWFLFLFFIFEFVS